MSANYTDQKNFIINDKYERTGVRLNLETTITKWLKIGAQTFGTFGNYSGASPELSSMVQAGPLRTPYDSSGNLVYQWESTLGNPFVPSSADDYDHTNSLFGNFYSKIDAPFIKGLSYTVNFGNNFRWNEHDYSNIYGASKNGNAYKRNDNSYDMTLDNIVSYKKDIAAHSLDLTLVLGLGQRNYHYTSAEGDTYSDLTLSYNSLQQGINRQIYSSAWKETSSYQMGRANYGFKNKYLVTATIRRDGFSGFSANEKTALFPSFALAWVASSESFLKKYDWLNNLKIRASLGKNGNLINRYASQAIVTSSASYVFGDGGTTLLGQEPTQLPNTNLKWESTTGLNVGIDIGLIQNRIRGSVEFYTTKTNNLLFNVNIPSINGASSVISNIGEIQNHGLEINLIGSIIRTKDLHWDLAFNYSRNTNEIKKLIGLDANKDGKEDDLVSSDLFIGRSLGAIYDYQQNGLWQIGDVIPAGYSEGTFKVVDQNNDGKITAADDRVILGKTEPAYRFSVQNQIDFKGFSLLIFINSLQGGKNGYLGNNDASAFFGAPVNARRHGYFAGVDYWTPSNPNAEYHIPGTFGAMTPGVWKDRSFARLQDVTLAYNFSSKLLDKYKIKALKVYISGKNLYTWTKWKGWDPEYQFSGSKYAFSTYNGYNLTGLPIMRNLSLGLDITF